jgi:hypothetical protein
MIPRSEAVGAGAFAIRSWAGPVSMEWTTNHLTRHLSIDLMPQSRHKKERFSPKGDECEPQRIAKSAGQIGWFSPEEFIQEKAGTYPATDRFQVLRLV